MPRITPGAAALIAAACFWPVALLAQAPNVEDPGPVFKTNSTLVEVYASIFDQRGNPMDGIPRERFSILDAGKPQNISSFEATGDEITCAILLDTTGSMRDTLGTVRNGVSTFIDNLRPADSVGLFSFNTALTSLQDFTTDKAAAKRALLRTRASGGTALFDAIAAVTKAIAKRRGKKVIVLFTDGADNASRLRPEAITRRASLTGVPLYAVAEGEATKDATLLKQLEFLAEQTGGVCYRARSSKDIATMFSNIQASLKHVYLLSFQATDGDRTKWRPIQVQVSGLTNYKVRGKQGYYLE